MSDPFLESKAKTKCKSLGNKLGEKYTIEELYNLILHLITFGKWQYVKQGKTDNYILEAVRNGDGINVIGFTNADLRSPKVYENFTEIQQAIQALPPARAGGPLGLGRREKKEVVPSEFDWVNKFNYQFGNNPLRDVSISLWKLVKIVPTIPRFHRGAFAEGKQAKYQVTFVGSAGYPLTMVFSPTDNIYVCSYDSIDTDEKKHRMRLYPGPTEDQKRTLCPKKGEITKKGYSEFDSKFEQITAKDIINEIINVLEPDKVWREVGGYTYEVDESKSDGIFVSWIEGYNEGVPVPNPKPGDTWNMRLIGIRALDDLTGLWQFTFRFPERGLIFSKTLKVPVLDSQKIFVCVPNS